MIRTERDSRLNLQAHVLIKKQDKELWGYGRRDLGNLCLVTSVVITHPTGTKCQEVWWQVWALTQCRWSRLAVMLEPRSVVSPERDLVCVLTCSHIMSHGLYSQVCQVRNMCRTDGLCAQEETERTQGTWGQNGTEVLGWGSTCFGTLGEICTGQSSVFLRLLDTGCQLWSEMLNGKFQK